MIKICATLGVFFAGYFLLYQYPGLSTAFFPLYGAFLIGIFLILNIETALLFGILTVIGAFGVLSRADTATRLHMGSALGAVCALLAMLYRIHSKEVCFKRERIAEISRLEKDLDDQIRERSMNRQANQSLDMRGMLQERMAAIVRELAGTLDPVVIRRHMFSLINEMITTGKKFLVSGSSLLDAADEWVMRQRIPILSRDVATDGRFLSKKINPNSKSLIVAPLVIQGRVEDILRIESEEKNAYDLTDLRIVELITLMSSVSLGNARLYALAESRAVNDGLTGLLAQSYFIEKLQQELLFASRYKTGAAVIMFDVDHFKSINDTHGHQAGDAVLKDIGQILRSAVHPTGSAARYGGEEFAVLLPQATRSHAKEIGSGILKTVKKTCFETAEYRGMQVTLSAGVAVFPEDSMEASQLLGIADSNLYRAKANGRDCIIG